MVNQFIMVYGSAYSFKSLQLKYVLHIVKVLIFVLFQRKASFLNYRTTQL